MNPTWGKKLSYKWWYCTQEPRGFFPTENAPFGGSEMGGVTPFKETPKLNGSGG